MCLKLRQKNKLRDNNRYAVDRIEENIIILENINTGKIIEINSNLDVKEGEILLYTDGQLIKDELEYNKRKERIKNKLESLKR